jgi:hypothetical protein
VAAIEAVLGAAGAWNRFTYLLVILYGYFLASDPRFGRALRRQWRIALPVGLALFVAVGVPGIYLFSQAGVDFQTDPGLPSVLFRILKGIVVWLLLVGILGFGGRMRPSDAGEGAAPKLGSGRPPDGTQGVPAEGAARVGHRLRERAAEFFRQGVLPIYLLHLPIVIVIGFFVVQWTPVLWLRFAIITLVSLVDTLVVYDLVRRTRVTRFLFGIKPRRSEPGGERTRSKGIPAQLGRLAVAASITLLVVLGGNSVGRSLIGRWEQTLDSSQPAAGYVAEFREDGTWEVTAEGESVGGTYALQGDEAIEIVYADGTESVSGLLMSADRFALISQDGDRVQVFMRSH